MAKLKFNQKFFKLDICGQEVQFRKWTAADEKKFLKVLNSKKENLNDLDVYNSLIKPILKENANLTSNEQKYLLMQVRKETFGKIVDYKVKCPKCGKINELKLNLDEIVKFKCSNFSDLEIIIDEETEEIVKEITQTQKPVILKIKFSRKNINKFKSLLYANQDPVDYIFTNFLTFIEEIEYNGETLKIENKQDFKDAGEFLDSLPTNIFEYIVDEFAKMSDEFKIEFNFTCEKCGYSENMEIDNIFEFLWD